MKFSKLKFLCDENVDLEVVDFLNKQGIDAVSAKQLKLIGEDDRVILKKAFKTGRVFITHDGDFGKIVYSDKANLIGIIYLRPGNFDTQFIVSTLKSILKANLDFKSPFILVAEQKSESIKIRLRNSL